MLQVVPLVPSARLLSRSDSGNGTTVQQEKEEEEDERRRKFIKYLKVRKRLLSPGAINFHLHFIFVSFATLESYADPVTRWWWCWWWRGRRETTETPWGKASRRGEAFLSARSVKGAGVWHLGSTEYSPFNYG